MEISVPEESSHRQWRTSGPQFPQAPGFLLPEMRISHAGESYGRKPSFDPLNDLNSVHGISPGSWRRDTRDASFDVTGGIGPVVRDRSRLFIGDHGNSAG